MRRRKSLKETLRISPPLMLSHRATGSIVAILSLATTKGAHLSAVRGSGHDRPPRRLPRAGPDDPVVIEVLLVLERVHHSLGLGTVDAVDGDAPSPLRHARLEHTDVVTLAPQLEVAAGPPGDAPDRRVAEAVDARHRPGIADAVVVVVAFDGSDDA